MKGSGSHLHAQVPPSTNEGPSELALASHRLFTYVDPSPLPLDLTAGVHYKAFSKHLTSYIVKEQVDATPRQQLAKLSPQQFQELCTDIYDELMRRQTNSETPKSQVAFLPAQAEFHPKRNQARERLATLRAPRLQDLTSDVRHELGRRYPACKGEPSDNSVPSLSSMYDNLPLAGIPNVPPGRDRDAHFVSSLENYPSSRMVVKTTTTVV